MGSWRYPTTLNGQGGINILISTTFCECAVGFQGQKLLCDWLMFSSADLSLAVGKMRMNQIVTVGFRYDFTESQAASCKYFSVFFASLESLKRVTGRIFKIVFSKALARTLILIFSSTKATKYFKNYLRIYKQYLFIIINL